MRLFKWDVESVQHAVAAPSLSVKVVEVVVEVEGVWCQVGHSVRAFNWNLEGKYRPTENVIC